MIPIVMIKAIWRRRGMGIRLELGIDKKNREGDPEELERGVGNVQTLFNDVL